MGRKIVLWIGNLLMILGVAVILLPAGPAILKEFQYQWLKLFPQKDLATESPVSPNEYKLIIPKLNAESEVIINVDPFDKQQYSQALKSGVAHAKNSALPGESGNVYLFAHSTDAPWNISRYNAEFYLLNKMELSDDIIINYHGKQYKYQVIGKKIINATDLSVFEQPENKYMLTLQTCWPPGTTWKRLIVNAQQVAPVNKN